MTGPACAGGCVPFYPGPMPRAGPVRGVRRANAGQVLPTRSRRPPGRSADMCVICVSCLCHNCVMFCAIFVSFMNKSLIFRPGDRPTAKRPKKSRLDFYVIYNIKIKKPRLHARAPHARLTRARTRPPARLTRACVK